VSETWSRIGAGVERRQDRLGDLEQAALVDDCRSRASDWARSFSVASAFANAWAAKLP
jgi:hypothetical protein